ncbi:MAG: hypothetical protein WDO73_09670 [Ignavibacteriota bacterium]
MTDHGDSQIGIQSPPVSLAQRDNVGLIEHGNEGPGNPVNSNGLVGQAPLRCLGKKTRGEKEWG